MPCRGLDMFVILGLDALILLLASKAPDNELLKIAAIQMTHAGWQGLRLYDLVFPVFVFIAGVSMSFSLSRHEDEKTGPGPGLLKIWKRASLLVLLGMLVNGPLTWTEDMRYASVLGLIGLSCAMGGTCVLLLRCRKAIAAATGGILAPGRPAPILRRGLHSFRLRQFMAGRAHASGEPARRDI